MARYELLNIDPLADSDPARTWRPWPIRTPSILAFATLCLFLGVCIELIVRGCSETGCRVFGVPSTIQVPPITNVIYNLLPTIFSVCFSLLWAGVHHHIIRLEPYFQMSTPSGALAQDSILLCYPYSFPLFLPFIAAKRRHYVVFLSSCILMLINLLITPLISGLFDDTNLIKHITSSGERAVMKSGNPQFSSRFSYAAYDYHWGSGSSREFTTPSYTLLPVKPGTMRIGDNETWSAETTLFEAELSCQPAVITNMSHPKVRRVGLNITTPLNNDFIYYLWDPGAIGHTHIMDQYPQYVNSRKLDNGSVVQLNASDIFRPFTTPWTSDVVPTVPRGRQPELSNTQMFLWASSAQPIPAVSWLPRNLTVIFCTAGYYSQSVIANITMPSGRLMNVNRTGTRTAFPMGTDFIGLLGGFGRNLSETLFKNLVDSNTYTAGLGSRPTWLPNVDSQLKRQLGLRPDGLDTGFGSDASYSSVFMRNVYTLPAFSLTNQTVKSLRSLLDPEVLAETYERELKRLFALAVALDLVDSGAPEPVVVSRDIYTRGFRVDIRWARGAQGGLGAVVIMTIVLAIINSRRRCMLDGEPNSIAASLQVLGASPEMCGKVENAEFHTEEELRGVLIRGSSRYKLVLVHGCGPRIDVIMMAGESERLIGPDNDNPEPCITPDLWALRKSSGVVFLIFFCLIIALLVVGYTYAHKLKGLPTFGGGESFLYKFLFSYVPFAVIMAIEPVLVSLASYYCMLGPYEALRRLRNSHSVGLLKMNYDKSPPHLQLLRSIRARDITLAVLTVAIILLNLLAVALGALFSLRSFTFSVPGELQSFSTPHIKGEFVDATYEVNYVLAANISDGNTAPRWTSPDYFVVPFYSANHGIIQGPTVGIGVDIKCSLLPHESVTAMCSKDSVKECASVDYSWKVIGWNIYDDCLKDINATGYDGRLIRLGENRVLRNSLCPDTFFAAWGEGSSDMGLGTFVPEENSQNQVIVLKCASAEIVHEITATVNEVGQVLSTNITRKLDIQEIAALYVGNGTIGTLSRSFIRGMHMNPSPAPELDTDLKWFSYLLVVLNPSIMWPFSDTRRIPDRTKIVAAFEDLYRRLFAINLRLYQKDILSPGMPYPASGTATVLKQRVDVNKAMMIVAFSVVIYTTIVLVFLYCWKRPQALSYAPTCLAAGFALLYASNAKVVIPGRTPEKRAARLDGQYRCGLFKGGDGMPHFGVYREDEEVEYMDLLADGMVNGVVMGGTRDHCII